jgi:serine/threonine-protein kinase
MSAQTFDGVADYHFSRSLGAGALGHSYLAERQGSQFVVKVLHGLPSEDAVAAFRHHVSRVGREHPNLARYASAGVAELAGQRVAYLTAEYEPGCSLTDLLVQEDPLDVHEFAEIAAGIACGLDHLHENGLTHRNIKPSNIWVSAARGAGVLLDYGVPDLVDSVWRPGSTRFTGDLVYASPEALAGLPTPSTDIYALGAVLYHALAGRPPLVAVSHAELVSRILEEDPEPPFAFNENIPHWIENAILCSLAKDAVSRPPTGAALARALRGQDSTRPIPAPEPYDRDSPPLLAARATSRPEARAIVDAVIAEAGPDIAVASVAEARALEELSLAIEYDKRLRVAVDTRIPDLEHHGFRRRRGQAERTYLPLDSEPYTPEALRSTQALHALAQADMYEQRREGATLLRSPAFPVRAPSSDWLPKNALLAKLMRNADAESGLDVYAMTRVDFRLIAHLADRASLVNRMAWSAADGYWVEVPGLSAATSEVLVACLDFALRLQQTGAEALWRVPDFVGEFAWSMGVAGIEVRLDTVGDFRFPEALPDPGGGGQQSRFSFRSIMASLPRDVAAQLLRSGDVAEASCRCPACVTASTPEQQVQLAARHNLETWAILAGELEQLTAEERSRRFEERLAQADLAVRQACSSLEERERAAIRRQLGVVADAFELAEERGVLRPVARLRTRGL